jgi:hypothetical protein
VTWQAIERAARAQVVADVEVLERTPLVSGEFIAWSTHLKSQWGHCSGLSPVHRVGQITAEYCYTTCGEIIPPAVRWLPLSPALVQSMEPCKHCAEQARMEVAA